MRDRYKAYFPRHYDYFVEVEKKGVVWLSEQQEEYVLHNYTLHNVPKMEEWEANISLFQQRLLSIENKEFYVDVQEIE